MPMPANPEAAFMVIYPELFLQLLIAVLDPKPFMKDAEHLYGRLALGSSGLKHTFSTLTRACSLLGFQLWRWTARRWRAIRAAWTAWTKGTARRLELLPAGFEIFVILCCLYAGLFLLKPGIPLFSVLFRAFS